MPTAFEQMKKEVPVSQDRAANALLQKAGKRIAAVATLPNAQWEFVECPSDFLFANTVGKWFDSILA